MGEQPGLEPYGKRGFFPAIRSFHAVRAVIPAGAGGELRHRLVLGQRAQGKHRLFPGGAGGRNPDKIPVEELPVPVIAGYLQPERAGGGPDFGGKAHLNRELRAGSVGQLPLKGEVPLRNRQVGDKTAVRVHGYQLAVYGEGRGGRGNVPENEGFSHGGEGGALRGVDEIDLPGGKRGAGQQKEHGGPQSG